MELAAAEYLDVLAQWPAQEVTGIGTVVLHLSASKTSSSVCTSQTLCNLQDLQHPSESVVSVPGSQSSGLKGGQTLTISVVTSVSLILSQVYLTQESSGETYVSLTPIMRVELSGAVTTQLFCTHFPQHLSGSGSYS